MADDTKAPAAPAPARFSDTISPASQTVTDASRADPAHPSNTSREPTASEFADMSPSQRADYRNRVVEAERQATDRTRTPDQPGRRLTVAPAKVSDAEYDKMTLAQRAVYAYEHQQYERQQAADGVAPAALGAPLAAPIKVGDVEVSEAELRDFLAQKAVRDSGQLSAPETAAAYKAELPASFKAPDGLGTFSFDETDPALQQAREWAHSNRLSQTQFSEALAIYAGMQAREALQFKNARDREIELLGAARQARVDAVTGWLKSQLPDKLAKAMNGMLVTADIVAGFETLLQRSVNQGAGNFSQQNRDHADRSEPDDTTWNSWSYAQKRSWQSQRNNGRA